MSTLALKSLVLCGSLLTAATATLGSAKAAPFQIFAQSECASGGNSCEFPAYTVPANRRIRINNVSCRIKLSTNATVSEVFLRKSGASYDYYTPTLMGNQPVRTFAFNAQTLYFADAGELLSLGLVAIGDIYSMRCKLAGDIAGV